LLILTICVRSRRPIETIEVTTLWRYTNLFIIIIIIIIVRPWAAAVSVAAAGGCRDAS